MVATIRRHRPIGWDESLGLAKDLRIDELEERRIVNPLLLKRILELEAENDRLQTDNENLSRQLDSLSRHR